MLWAVVFILAQAPSPELERAELNYREGQFDQLLASVGAALRTKLTDEQRVRAFHLKAMAHAAFDDESATVEAFRRALTLDAAYDPTDEVSPKVRAAFEKAKLQGPIDDRPAVPPEALPSPAPEQSFASKPLFWVVVGAGAIAIGVGVAAAASRSAPPSGNLGRSNLP